jgi:GNAT superfamily N-acetyltransferase
MKIRDLAWGDFSYVTENYFELYDEVKENPDLGISLLPQRPAFGDEVEWFARLFRRTQEGNSVAAVAEEGGRVVGLCAVDRKGPHQEEQHIGVLGISVARRWRGKGIGKALLQAVIERCRGKFELLELSVYGSNLHARQLYRSVGFRPWGLLPKGIQRGDRYIDLEYMVMELTPVLPR